MTGVVPASNSTLELATMAPKIFGLDWISILVVVEAEYITPQKSWVE